MRSSKIPFCESIPDSWNEIPNRFLFEEHSVKVGERSSEYQLLSLTTSGVKEKSAEASGGKVPESYDNYQTVEKGDMIFCLFDLDCSAVFSGLSNYDGMITSAYDVFRPNAKYVDQHYLDYWFQYVFSHRYYKMYSKNIRYTVTREAFNGILTPVPPLAMQKKIGSFLDKKCAQIDTLIANQEKQIEKLKQYKQALITEVVTKGLDPTVPMKDSGVEWIGKIPEHWSTLKIKYATLIRDEKYQSGEYPYIALENVESFSGQYVETNSVYELNDGRIAHCGDVIFGKLRPYLAKAYLILNDSCVNGEFAVFSPIKTQSEYLKFFMLSTIFVDTVNASTYGTKMPRANIDFIGNLSMSLPPMGEQKTVSAFLNAKSELIDLLIAKKRSKIEKLNQYKKSLIYEYVTGKKEVLA